MIYAIIALAEGVVIALLAILAFFALRANSRLTREKNAAMRALEEALAGKEALKEQNGRLNRENAEFLDSLKELRLLYNKVFQEREELAARSTALSEALEARPTLPAKRVVRKPQTTEEA